MSVIEAKDVIGQAVKLAEELRIRSGSTGKPSIFGLVCTGNERNPPVYLSRARDTAETIGCAAVFRNGEFCLPIARAIDGLVDYILLDVEAKIVGWAGYVSTVIASVQNSTVLTYHPNDLTASSADALIAQAGIGPDGRAVAIIGAGHVGGRIAQRLVERGYCTRLWRRNPAALSALCDGINALRSKWSSGIATAAEDAESACSDARVLLGCTPGTAVITGSMIQKLASDAIILDVGNGSLSSEAIQLAHSRRLKVLCCDTRTAYEGGIVMLLRTAELVRHRIGRRQIGALTLISGGILGERGDVVVDNCKSPTCIIGIADGRGDVVCEMDSPEWQNVLGLAKQEILRHKMEKR